MKRFLSVLLTIAMLLSLVTISAVAEEEAPLVIDVYDDAANYNGTQTGWFAKVIKDRFNIELNIIASQVVVQHRTEHHRVPGGRQHRLCHPFRRRKSG